jgi:hypothetical protein
MNQLSFLESELKMPLMSLPVRTVFVPINGGGVLISPGSQLKEEQLKKLKKVTDIVAPSLFHCAGVPKASRIFPNAKKWSVKNAKKAKPRIAWTDELSFATWPYHDQLPMVELQGIPKINEVLFYHKDSKSLIVTDLCFNLVDAKGLGAWIILNLFGTYRKLGVSKFFLKFCTDRIAFEKSLNEVFALDFQNIIVSHGSNIIGNAKEKLRFALEERGFRVLKS